MKKQNKQAKTVHRHGIFLHLTWCFHGLFSKPNKKLLFQDCVYFVLSDLNEVLFTMSKNEIKLILVW